jgi:hypothetical protein
LRGKKVSSFWKRESTLGIEMVVTLFRDQLPKGLCFPLGVEALSKSLAVSNGFKLALLCVWRSTWASQILHPVNGEDGDVAIFNVSADIPRIRINTDKVRPLPPECEMVITEFAVASGRRREILEAFLTQGASLVSERLADRTRQPFQVRFNIDAKRIHLSAKKPITAVG